MADSTNVNSNSDSTFSDKVVSSFKSFNCSLLPELHEGSINGSPAEWYRFVLTVPGTRIKFELKPLKRSDGDNIVAAFNADK